MLSRSLPMPLRRCHVRLLRTLVWRAVSSSLNCMPLITKGTKTWASISRCVLNQWGSVKLPYLVNGNLFIYMFVIALLTGRWTSCEGCFWMWCSGALPGQILGHKTGHKRCHHSTESWPGVYANMQRARLIHSVHNSDLISQSEF